jgi:hypothetical protein
MLEVKKFIKKQLNEGTTILRFRTHTSWSGDRCEQTELDPSMSTPVFNEVKQAVIDKVKETVKMEISQAAEVTVGNNFDYNFKEVLVKVLERTYDEALVQAFTS